MSKTTNKHTPLPWVVELNPTIPEGIQVAAFETTEEMAGNRHLQIIIRSHNPDADAELIVKAVNNYDKLRDECDALRAECDALRAKTSMSIGVGDGTGSLFVHGDYDSIKRVQALIFECEKLRKDAEFGRSVLSKREPGKVYGCHCDLEEGMEPDGCVIDEGSPHQCVYAKHISTKEQCKYWQVIVSDANQEIKHGNQ